MDPEAAEVIARAADLAGETWLRPAVATHGPEDLITPMEAAELAGVAVRTVYDWVSSGRVPHYLNKQGRIQVRVNELLATQAQTH